MNDTITAKRMLGKLLAPIWRSTGPRRCVLLYHAIGTSPWAISVEDFRAQLAWLAANAAVGTLDQVLDGSPASALSIAITFDDGYACLADQALPVLKDLGLTATAYLNTGWIMDGERRDSDAALGHYPAETFMNWADVEQLASQGWTIGSHGVEHLDLTCLAPEAVDRELLVSRQTLQQRLGVADCRHFSYTWGRHSPALRSRVDAAGYRYAAAGHHAPLRAGDDPLAFPRINVARDYTLDDFKAIVRGDWDYLGWVQRARAWRR
ncbi:polysaccharide deacetylase family protein [Thiohalocapsa marina]|uniref:Polysaccharide deacetylase family protein n=1 Tax=Thiohalocapsa marina TaxID=424902 RepID=A0A5M8FIZ1_9GAMM|nr:polysaccharide deacetylase family protein [Thiohalocapsa marina]KAA6183950.1 polysaccharide deacetylase family protein [Thiohalocapsa marina]